MRALRSARDCTQQILIIAIVNTYSHCGMFQRIVQWQRIGCRAHAAMARGISLPLIPLERYLDVTFWTVRESHQLRKCTISAIAWADVEIIVYL
jgi:hypothetical protein